ncbi:hypothetical protein RRG08_047380 [Elysia crispata]|uniref:Uncharacterized protein n=1 Tax=Elysia crispata TaxID=231223 RepID=A0AAE0Y2D1_9GAST|nr:hypothetical protein RRG08_047380 [Elysia crispata]
MSNISISENGRRQVSHILQPRQSIVGSTGPPVSTLGDHSLMQSALRSTAINLNGGPLPQSINGYIIHRSRSGNRPVEAFDKCRSVHNQSWLACGS